ncbi:MAG: hypothetical protein SF182_02065 [Deltaproteobacteria bacterium]|nr:hypothetical protein [Deltaproteobacteria bacterium]
MRTAWIGSRAALLALVLASAATAQAGLDTPRPLPRSGCAADCDRSGAVVVNELLRAVNIALDSAPLSACAAADRDGSHGVSVDEILAGVSGALGGCTPAAPDPGAEAWQPVPRDQVVSRCGLDPDLLDAADPQVNRRYAVIRYGQLCHVYYPEGSDARGEVFSTTKTLGALTTGIAAWETRALPRNGSKTGPLSDTDPVSHWLDSFTFNAEAQIAHVLAMLAQNPDLSFGQRTYSYDLVGAVQINRLSDVITAAIAQDSARLGATVEEFVQRFLFGPLGMHDSEWSNHDANKILGFTWQSTVLDMARVGLLLLHDGWWNGRQVLGADWTYKMTHPSFEDANTGYGYLTWLNSDSNHTFGLGAGPKLQQRVDPCGPVALWPEYPHGLSGARDCGYQPPLSCEQTYDVGVFYAAGLGGQYIVGHRGLDLVLVVKDSLDGPGELWSAVRPALVALDPAYAGDEPGFCAAYAAGNYAPDLLGE